MSILIPGAEEIYNVEPMKDSLWQYNASLPKSSFSGCDISVIGYIDGKIKKFGELLTMSYSVHREKTQVRTMGRVNPKGFTRGTRCLPATEKVLVDGRGYININEVDVGDFVQSLPGRYDKVIGAYFQGVKECHDLRLGNGYSLTASYDHPISTSNGWVPAADLKPGDLVNVASRSPVPEIDMDISDDILIMIAYLIGDGTTLVYPKKTSGSKEYRVSLAIGKTEMGTIGAETERILNGLGIQFWDYEKDNCINRRISVCLKGFAKTDHRLRQYNQLHEWLLRLGIYGKYSYQKFIPQEFIAQLSVRQIKLFLSRLYSADGCYSISKDKKYVEAQYTSTSEELIDGTRLLLNKLGINAIKSHEYLIGKEGGRKEIIHRHDSYRLTISMTAELVKFIETVGIFAKDERIAPVKDLLIRRINDEKLEISMKEFTDLAREVVIRKNGGKKRLIGLKALTNKYNLNSYKLPVTPRRALAVAAAIDDEEFTKKVYELVYAAIYKERDFVQVPVVSNTPIGPLSVYDLTVENNHSFIANFILVHNTIAGSLIFVSMDRTALWDWLGHNDYDPPDTMGELPMIDQLPPMDVSISFSNEYGSLSTIRIYGIELVDHGMTMSVDDMITEQVISYMAIGMQEMAPEGLEHGPSGKTWATTGIFYNGFPVETEMNRTHGILKKISELNTEIMAINAQIAKLEGVGGDQVAISLLRRKLISSSAELDRWQAMATETQEVDPKTKNAQLDQFGRYRDDLLGGLKPYVLP